MQVSSWRIRTWIGFTSSDSVSWRECFPEIEKNEMGVSLADYRYRESLTQHRLSELTGIPRRHISEMENIPLNILKALRKEIEK